MMTVPNTAGARKPRLARLFSVALLLAVAGAAVWWRTRPQPVVVALRAVDRGAVERSIANTRAGTIKACRRARLAPLLGGQIVALPVREGDRVRAGQVLLE